MSDALKLALDRFDVPSPSAALADRIMAAAATPVSSPSAPPRRDRRGMWRRGRQILLGTMAVGLLSAGAVASGLLGKVGIEVPVLTAMLAPKTIAVAKPTHSAAKRAPARVALAPPPVALVDPTPNGLLPRPLLPPERMALREERRERREAFAAEHPVAAAMIRERVRERLQRRALERRTALMGPAIDPSIPGARLIDPLDRLALARAARRDRLIAEKMIDRRIQAREARLSAGQSSEQPALAAGTAPTGALPTPVGPVARQDAPTFGRRIIQIPEARAARRERLQQMTPEQRGRFREKLQQRRMLRRQRKGASLQN